MNRPLNRILVALLGLALTVQSLGAAAAAPTFRYRVPLNQQSGAPSYKPDSAVIAALTANLYTVTAGASSSVSLLASLKDGAGVAAPKGEVVTWSATGGSLSSTGSTTVRGSAGTTLSELTRIGAVDVTARAGSSGATRTTTIQVVADASAAKVSDLEPTSDSISAGGAQTTITATLQDPYGNALGADIPVTWSTTLGTLSAESTSTNSSGTAAVTLTAPAILGTASITARAAATGDVGKTTVVSFIPDVNTARVTSFAVSPSTITANGSASTTLTATVKDANGNVVGAGVPVNWTTTTGALAASRTNTDASGTAAVTLRASTVATTANVTAKGAAGDTGQTKAVVFAPDAATARVSNTWTNATQAVANGGPAVTLTTTLKDANGNVIPGGTVNWSTSLGTVAATSVANASGVASVVLYAPTTLGTANVRAWGAGGEAGQTVQVGFIGDVSTARVVQAFPWTPTMCNSPSANTQMGIYAVVRDAYNNPLPAGVPVVWWVDRGYVAEGTSYTDGSSAVGVVYTAPAGQVNVTTNFAARTANSGVWVYSAFWNQYPC